MNVNLLAISIGNTRTQLGVFHEGTLQTKAVVTTDVTALAGAIKELFSVIAEEKHAFVLLASVNPAGTQLVTKAAKGIVNIPIQRVEKDMTIPVGRQLDRESIVGEDRLLNAAAAFDTLKQTCVIVDAGTAITVDLVDGKGTFHGGAIGPGASLMLKSLHDFTAQLPEVTFAKPQEVVGHSTTEAMRTAAYHGLRGMVRELVEQYAETIGAYPLVIATGGDSEVLFENYDLVDRVVPDLSLIGLRVTLETWLKDEDGD